MALVYRQNIESSFFTLGLKILKATHLYNRAGTFEFSLIRCVAIAIEISKMPELLQLNELNPKDF